jgi:RNA polymerase sigma factor (sigma-70 family)
MGKRMMDDDAQLLRRYAREGAEEAFAELVRRHLGLVYGSALRRVNGNAALAEEVAQEVFASVAHEAAMLEKKVAEGVTLAGWIYVMTKHAAANVVRAEGRRVRREQEAFVMSELESGGAGGMTAAGAGDAEVWGQVRPELEAVMDELGEKDREAVLLRFFEGRAFGEIGAALRVSEDAARVRVNRALEKMRALLARRGVTSTAAALGGLLAGNAAVAAPAGMAASVTASAVAAGGAAVVSSVGAASAVGVSGLGTGILSFMTTTKLVTGVACVVAALAVGTAVHERREQAAAQTEIARLTGHALRLTQRVDELENARTEAEAKVQAAAKQVAQQQQLQKSVSGDSASSGNPSVDQQRAVATAREKARKAKETAQADGQEFVAKNSQGRALLIDIGRAQIAQSYAGFYRMAKLTPAQIEAFEDATNAHWLSSVVMTPNSIQPADPNLPAEKARAILGEAGFAQLEQFRRLQPLQSVVNQISNLSPETQLTREQSAQLLTIMANASPAYQAGGIGNPNTIDWTQAEAQARSVLTASQLEALHAESLFPSLMTLVKGFYEERATAK